jgi:hypothetical protein
MMFHGTAIDPPRAIPHGGVRSTVDHSRIERGTATMIGPPDSSSMPGRGAERRRRHLVGATTVSSVPSRAVTQEPSRRAPGLPLLFVTGEFGLAGALQVALHTAVDIHIVPRWDDAFCVAAARAWPVILLDCATTALSVNPGPRRVATLRSAQPSVVPVARQRLGYRGRSRRR